MTLIGEELCHHLKIAQDLFSSLGNISIIQNTEDIDRARPWKEVKFKGNARGVIVKTEISRGSAEVELNESFGILRRCTHLLGMLRG